MAKFGNAYGDTALDALASVAARHGVAPATVALAWVLHNPVVSSAVVGVRTCAQLWDLVRAGRVELSGSDLEMLNRATAMEPVKMAAPAQKEPEAELVPAS
jgi:aryl-alcohol dehydrogenase-like predicted oxidoreductase